MDLVDNKWSAFQKGVFWSLSLLHPGQSNAAVEAEDHRGGERSPGEKPPRRGTFGEHSDISPIFLRYFSDISPIFLIFFFKLSGERPGKADALEEQS